MKNKLRSNKFIFITVLFYISILLISFFKNGGNDYFSSIKALFSTAPSNYLIYFIPPIAALFFSKQPKATNNDLFLFSVLTFLSATAVYTEPNYKYDALLLTYIAIISASFILININTMTASIILIPGLFISKLGIGYILTAYIPLLILLLLQSTALHEEKKEKKNSLSGAVFWAYMYIAILTVILLIAKKLNLNIEFIKPQLYHAYEYINLIAGLLLIFTAMTMFLIRAHKITANGSVKEKLTVIIYAVYPLIFTAVGIFTNMISENNKSTIIAALIIYIIGNMQLSITYKEKCSNLVPEQLKNEGFVCLAVALFCALCFSHN